MPDIDKKFGHLDLSAELLDNLNSLGYQDMTVVQSQSLPFIVAGRDVIAQAKTGSGKTAAFGLGLLHRLDVKKYRVQSLVLCPTRELADQVAKEIRKLARAVHNIKVLTLCGGTAFGPQVGSLEHGAHIVVGTPGRVEEHLRKSNLCLKQVNCFVLDEADRMLDSGFQDSLDNIITYLPEQRQTLLFSATYPPKIETVAKRIMQSPVMVTVAEKHSQNSIQQVFFEVSKGSNDAFGTDSQRSQALRLLLLQYRPQSTLVFCNTKRETSAIAEMLHQEGFSAIALHGDLEQKQRDQILVRFANRSISILVATDVAARGLDIEQLDAVINYQVAKELEVHTHRVGRTGRIGHQGLACTLFSASEKFKLDKLALLMASTPDEKNNPASMLDIQPLPAAHLLREPGFKPSMVTLQIDAGKKQKIRPGDILGALTGKDGIAGSEVGKIAIFDFVAYVAVSREASRDALSKLQHGTLKGRSCRVRRL